VKSILARSLRFAFPAVILVWLIFDIHGRNAETLAELRNSPKDYWQLTLAACLCLIGFCLSFVRWYLLVVALRLPFQLRDAFRLGFLGQMLGFVSLGSVGGDLFKALFIARAQQTRRAEAVASVFVDRAVGLYGMLILVCISLFGITVGHLPPAIIAVVKTSEIGFLVGTFGLATLLLGWIELRWFDGWLRRYPWAFAIMQRIQDGLDHYRDKPVYLGAAVGLAVVSHVLIATSLFVAANGLTEGAPSWLEHCVIWPLGGAASALPLAPAGLGTFELALSYLYGHFSTSKSSSAIGLVVALGFRCVTIAAALVGFMIYWKDRQVIRKISESA
jgi:uncharacterized membrane protein YbhN (UPF0104 family)